MSLHKKISDHVAHAHAVVVTVHIVKLYFVCCQSGNRMERYTNLELDGMHLAYVANGYKRGAA